MLQVVRNNPDRFQVVCLTAQKNVDLLVKQALEFKPELICIADSTGFKIAKERLANTGIHILCGKEGLSDLAREAKFDMMIGAIVGFAGLMPTIEAIKAGKNVALANKETLVVAGEIVNRLLETHRVTLMPIDSEHSALFQCLVGESKESIRKIILTASGGPFLDKPKDQFGSITVSEALKHPNWNMGSKITIDSATLMNKGLEVIEARWLFGLPKEKISVVVHPQSIIHSMVEFVDGSVKAQLGMPDMRLPIQYALTFPKRLENDFPKTDFTTIKELTFFEPDLEKFQCLKLAYDALKAEGTAPCILNAANEIAVKGFLKGEISFSKIPFIIDKALEKIENHSSPNLETIIECDKVTRKFAEELI